MHIYNYGNCKVHFCVYINGIDCEVEVTGRRYDLGLRDLFHLQS